MRIRIVLYTHERPVIQSLPIRWRVLGEWCPSYGHIAGGIYIEERLNRHGNTMYAIVLRDHWELSKEMNWDYMPIPSERSDEYLQTHRWDSLTDVICVAQMAAEVELEEHPNDTVHTRSGI
jgi:hypothetical protein